MYKKDRLFYFLELRKHRDKLGQQSVNVVCSSVSNRAVSASWFASVIHRCSSLSLIEDLSRIEHFLPEAVSQFSL